MNLTEELKKIKSIIYELSPQSYGVSEVLDIVKEFPEIITYLNFEDFENLESYILDAKYSEFAEIRKEIDEFFNKRNENFKDEMDEIERASQDLNRDEKIDISVNDIMNSFMKAKEVDLDKDTWSKLENTESCDIKKGELNKVIDIAKKYNKTNPLKIKKSLMNGDYRRPLILKINDRYHLVAGNTRLCTAAAMGITPKVIIGEILIDGVVT